MARINADPDLLEQVARELTSIAGDMDRQGSSLGSAASQTAMAWKSRYTNQYLESVSATRRKIGSSSANVRSAAAALRRIAGEVRRAEREIQRLNAGGGR